MWRLVSTLYFLLAALGAGAPLCAQSDAPLPDYWRALEAASSLTELSPPRGPADSAVAHGLYLLRRWELGRDRSDALRGRQRLERAVAREPDNAWAHFALGALLARGPDVREVLGPDPGAYVVWRHSLAAQRAPRALRRALQLEPGLHEAAFVLARLALDLGDRHLVNASLEELVRGGRARDARALALRAELTLLLGETQRSAELADSARRRGADPAVAAHLRAAALLRQPGGEAEGARVYLEGVASLTEAGAVAYFDALSAILSPRAIAAWSAADLAGRGAWLRRFWEVQAALAGVPLPERLAAHYRRLADVRSAGRGARMGAAGAAGAFDARAYGVGSMGDLLHLRHGDSLRAERVLFCGPDVLDLPLPLQPGPAECRRTPMGRLRARMLADAPRLLPFQAEDRALPGSSYYPAFETHLALAWDLLQFRGAGRHTAVVASLAVPASSARALLRDGVLTARTELLLVDTAAGTVQRGEALRRLAAGTLPETGHVLLDAMLEAQPAADLVYRVALTDSLRRAGRIVGGTVTLRDFHSGALALSDVVLAPVDGSGSFARGDERLSLAPGREFGRTETVLLYYEVYGLPAGATYRTEIVIEPQPESLPARVRALFPGGRDALRLSFTEEAAGAHEVWGVQQLRRVGLAGLLPGTYTLRVKVSDAAGAAAAGERELYVVAAPRR